MIRIKGAVQCIGAIAVTLLIQGLSDDLFAAPPPGRPANTSVPKGPPSFVVKPSKARAGQSSGNIGNPFTFGLSGQRLNSGSKAANKLADEGFRPATLEGEEADQRYAIWGGVLP